MVRLRPCQCFIGIYFLVLLTFVYLQSDHHHLSRLFANISLTDDLSANIDVICPSLRNLSSIDLIKYSRCFTKIESNVTFSLNVDSRQRLYPKLFNSSSLIITVGGHDRTDLQNLIDLFDPFLIHFVPLKNRYATLRRQFRSNSKVKIRPFGLSNEDKAFVIERTFETMWTVEQIRLLNVVEMVQTIREERNSSSNIDLLSLQCHGCELEILPALIETKLIESFRLIQFYNDAEIATNETCIYCQLEQQLPLTHRSLYYDTRRSQGWILK